MQQSLRTVARPFALTMAAVLLAACGSGGGTPTQAPGTQAPATQGAGTTQAPAEGDPTPGTTLTACQLVAPADIEAALKLDAGTVAEGTFKETGTTLDRAANECRYTGDWGGLIVSSTPTDGPNVFDALVKAYGDEAEALQIGDGSLWFQDDKRGYFLKGVVLVRLQFTHIADGTPVREPTIAIGTAAIGKV